MSAYLRYYFSYDGKSISVDSMACVEGVECVEPANFLKWYEEGDLAQVVNVPPMGDSLFNSLFGLTFTIVDDLKASLESRTTTDHGENKTSIIEE